MLSFPSPTTSNLLSLKRMVGYPKNAESTNILVLFKIEKELSCKFLTSVV